MKKELLRLTEIDQLTYIRYKWFYFEFEDLSKFETSSMLIYLNNKKNLDIREFIKWLNIRQINYEIKFIYIKDQSFLSNLKAYCFYLKIIHEL